MPEWLLRDDEYNPPKGKSSFAEKNIVSILEIIGKIKANDAQDNGILNINTLTKFISMLVLIILVSLSKNFTFIVISNVILLVIINFLSTKQMKQVLKTVLVVEIFSAVIFLPSVFLGYGKNTFVLLLRIFFCTSIANIFAIGVKLEELTTSLKIFHIPDMFIFVLDITIKYIIVLGDLSLNMVYALKLKAVGRIRKENKSFSGILGTVFIKSKESSEDMYFAMECRGFTGNYKVYRKFKFSFKDCLCFGFDILFIIMYIYFDRL